MYYVFPVLFKEILKLLPNKFMNLLSSNNYTDNLDKLIYHIFLILNFRLKCSSPNIQKNCTFNCSNICDSNDYGPIHIKDKHRTSKAKVQR